MKPEKQHLEMAVAQLTILRYFPAEPIARAAVMRILAKMVGTVEQLNWLVDTMIDRVGEWCGPAQLRAVFATRFKPADGIEGETCSISGFTPADSEARCIAEATQQRYLPAPEEPLSDEERASIAELQRNVEARNLKAARERLLRGGARLLRAGELIGEANGADGAR